ncbi:MAG: amidohydrolase [Clostridium sp.]|uniref:amidohydrolase n=1 Tax=Clostridium sp. TaxID=1506 RepID=UPI003033F408
MNTLFFNGKIASLDCNNNFYQAIGIKDNKINFLGTDLEALELKNSYDEIIDLNKKTLLPGFNDSHMHLLNYGYTLEKMDLTKLNSIDEIITSGKNFIDNRPSGELNCLLGRGWNQDRLKENRFVTLEDLDKISTDIPVIFTRVCGHIAICNTKALSYLNIKDIKDNPNIDIKKGVFKEYAISIINGIIPPPSIESMKNMIINTCKELLTYGITSVQTDDFDAMPNKSFKNVLIAYNELIKEDKLPVRIYEQCLFETKENFKDFINLGYKTGDGDNFFKIGPLKLLLDGALGGRTASLRKPYTDDPTNCGISIYNQEELDNYIKVAHDNGFQTAAHAIGDNAMDLYLNALEKLGVALKEQRHGIVHCQITSKDIMERMKNLDIMAYIQPIFLDYDMHIVEDRVGERAKESYAFKTMEDLGIKLSIGSDAPVVHFNPFENIYSAVCRKDLSKYPENGFMPLEKLSLESALKMFTIDSAYCSFEENIKGSLELGKLADLVVLDRDIFTIPEDEIKDIHAEITMVDGKIVYQ